jgi:hypothetical protein
MAWNHPIDVPIRLTRRASALHGVDISQNDYAAVVADAYEDVTAEFLRDLMQAADEATQGTSYIPQDTPVTVATAKVLGLPWQAVDAVFRVFEQEAARAARERQAQRQKQVARIREGNAETLERLEDE